MKSKGEQTKIRETRVTDLLKSQVPEDLEITLERKDWFGEENSLD